jgi:SNF2 family DNA or RNA helicase
MKLKHPKGLQYRRYQKTGIRFMLKHKRCLNADEMRLGKTVQAIGTWNNCSAETVLIVCPVGPKLVWARHFKEWACKSCRVRVLRAGRTWPNDGTVYILNFDIVDRYLNEIQSRTWDMLIVDEAHYLKTPTSKRTKLILGGISQKGIRARRKIFLTGTPVENRPIELWPLISVIDPKGLGESYMDFAYQYCFEPRRRMFGGLASQFKGAKNLDELHGRLSKFMVRRLRSQVTQELPQMQEEIVPLEVIGKYASMVKEEWIAYRRYRAAIMSANKRQRDNALATLARLRRSLAVSKVPAVVEHLLNSVEQGNSVICFAHHKEVVDSILQRLTRAGVKCDAIVGSTRERDRDAIEAAFKVGKLQVLIAHFKVLIGKDVSRANHVVFAELDWNPGVMMQAKDRVIKIGKTDTVSVDYIVINGSIDDRFLNMKQRKEQHTRSILDGKN